MPNNFSFDALPAIGITSQLVGIAATITGVGISTAGFDEMLVIANVGLIGASGTMDIHLEDSDAVGGTYAAITGAVFTQFTPSNDLAVYKARLKLDGGVDAFVRAIAVDAVATAQLAVEFILFRNVQSPQGSLDFNV